jgi:hypothetical protein
MSGYSTTPSLGLKKPLTGADDDLWGTHWNDNADILDTVIGPLTASSVTSVAGKTGAVTLVHTDITDWNTAVPSASTAPPLMDGAATVGTSALYAREGHVHPSDTTRQTAAQVQAAVAPAFNGTGRNLVHNPMFNIAQRGAGPFTTSGVYTLDRWSLIFVTDTNSVIQFPINDANRAQIGDEEATNVLGDTIVGNSAAGAFSVLFQRIENVRRTAGKTITVSFWAAGSVTRLGVSVDQDMGTGGSPSAIVLNAGQSVAITGIWTRYSLTMNMASLSGKTLGTNGNSCASLNFWFSSGANQSARAGNVGVQSGQISIWGVQLEIGTVATPLEKLEISQDFRNCQRFYAIIAQFIIGGYAVAGTTVYDSLTLPVPMHHVPIVTFANSTTSGTGAITTNATGPFLLQLKTTVSATGGFFAFTDVIADANF